MPPGRSVGFRPGDLDNRDPDFMREVLPATWLFVTAWFRPDIQGLHHIPSKGPVLVVGNHTGGASSPAAQAPQSSSEPGDPAKEKLYYDAAFDLIKAKDFDKASQAFAAFLRKYPNSQYAGNAQYWLGEVNLAKGDLQGAGQAFAKVSQLYPKHAKVPDSLYKLADVERRLGHTDKVKGILQQVVAQYPGTSAAQLAQRDLQRL